MALTVYQILEAYGLAHLAEMGSDEDFEKMDREVEVHVQPSYPLQATVANAKVGKDGQLMLAISSESGYGKRSAWDDSPEGEEDDDC